MRRLHDTTRKRICRGAFFALCVAPTCATLAWAVGWHLPSQYAARAERVEFAWHARAALDGWREPKPGLIRVERATLAERLSGADLIEAEGVESLTISGVPVVTAKRVTINAAEIAELSRRIVELLHRDDSPTREVRIAELVVERGGVETSLDSVVARVAIGSAKILKIQAVARTSVDAGKEAANSGDMVRLTIERSASPSDGSSARVVLDARGAKVPAALVASLAPGFDGIGAQAAFSGSLDAQLRGNRLAASRAVGRLEGVDLAATLPSVSPHAATGFVSVDLEEATWSDGALVRLAGRLSGRDVRVSPSIVAAAANDLFCVPAPLASKSNAQDLVEIDELAATFVFDEKGLTVWGVCPTSETVPVGVIATRGGQTVLAQPQYVDIQCGSWVRFLLGTASGSVLSTREAIDVARRLPLPASGAAPK